MQDVANLSVPKLSNGAASSEKQESSLAQLDGGPPRPFAGNSAWSLLQRGMELSADKTALIVAQQPVDHLKGLVGPSTPSADCLTWSYTQLLRGATRLAAVFEEQVIMPNSTVAYLIPSGSEWALLVWVAALSCYNSAGLSQTLLRPDTEAELHRCLQLLTPSSIVVEHDADAARIDGIRDKTVTPFLGLCLGPVSTPRQGWLSLCDIAATRFANDETPIRANPASDSLDRIVSTIFTSGSSGLPKCVQKTVRTLLASTATRTPPKAGPTPAPTPVSAVITSNSQTVAFGMLYYCWHNAGAVVIPAGEFSPSSTLHAIERYRVSIIGHMPEYIRQIFTAPDFSMEKVKSLRSVFVTGAVVTAAEIKDLQRVVPSTPLYPIWGMSEAVGVLGWPVSFPTNPPTHMGAVSSGTVMPGARVRIVAEDGQIVRRGVLGEMHVGGDAVFSNYMGAMDRSNEYVDVGGKWFRTGDVAVMDESGLLYILGRSQDIIRTKEGPVFPSTLEDHLMTSFRDRVCLEPHDLSGLPKRVTNCDIGAGCWRSSF